MVEIIVVLFFDNTFYSVTVLLDFATVLKVAEFPFSAHFVTILNPIFFSVVQCIFGCSTFI
jgi:hypothetical protein